MSCENCEESAYVIDKLAKLLAEIAVIVNGPEPPLTSWSYHDLPEKVRALKEAQQPAAAVPEGYALVPVEPTDAMVREAGFAVTDLPVSDYTARAVWEAMLAAASPAAAVPAAMRVVTDAMRSDPGYAWSWHCNVAMAFVDEGGDHATANHAAARFMRLLAGVEPAHELPPKQAQRPAAAVQKGYALVPAEEYVLLTPVREAVEEWRECRSPMEAQQAMYKIEASIGPSAMLAAAERKGVGRE